MARPTQLPNFATNDEVDPIYGTPNKVEPSTEKKDFGQRGDKNTLRQDINWLFNKIREWIEFFREQYQDGDVYIVTDSGQTEAQISAQLGGTWQFYDGGTGQTTLGGVNVLVFEKLNDTDL